MPPRRDQAASTPGGLLVTQVRSAIGSKPLHRGSLRALGLRKIGQSNVLPDTKDVRGIIARVAHLVSVDPAPPEAAPTPARAARRASSTGGS
jgi:large subunit ribosomal protein L30